MNPSPSTIEGNITLDTTTGQFTIGVAGTYLVTANINFPLNSVGSRQFYLYKIAKSTNVISLVSADGKNATSDAVTYLSLSEIVYLNAGDRLFFAVTQNSGGILSIGTDNIFAIKRLA
jgi:hypothetical protein